MSKQSLLLVDGDTRSLRVLEVSLRKAGFTVTPAVSVKDALDKLELHTPDLIISETQFPTDLDGFELRRRLRAVTDWADIPFVFLTTETAIENKIRGLELGVEDYLTKPIYIKEIVTRINILLQKKQRAGFDDRKDGMRFAGRVADMPVVDVIQTIEVSRKSGVIQFVGTNGRQAAIYFRDGKVIDAEAGTLQGEDAVYRLLTWSDGDFEVVFRTVRRREAIQASSQGLLMEGMRRLDEWSRLLEQLPPLGHRFEIDVGELASRLGEVPDDNNRILRLIDGKRSLLEVIDASDFGDLECLQVVARLFFEGLLVDLDPDVKPKRDTGKPMPLVVVEEPPTPIEEVASGPIDISALAMRAGEPAPVAPVVQPIEDLEPAPEEARPPGPLLGGYRPSSLRLIDEAVAAAQAIEPSLFEPEELRAAGVAVASASDAGPEVAVVAGPATVARVKLEKREVDPRVSAARDLVEKQPSKVSSGEIVLSSGEIELVPTNGETEIEPANGDNGAGVIELIQDFTSLATADDDTGGVPTAIEAEEPPPQPSRRITRERLPEGDGGEPPHRRFAATIRREDSGLKMIGSAGRDRAEASGEVRMPARQAEPSAAEPARELVTILPRRKTGEFAQVSVPDAPPAPAKPEPKPEPVPPPPTASTAKAIEPPARPSAARVSVAGGVVRKRGGPGPAAASLLVVASLLSGATAFMYCHKRLTPHHAAAVVPGDAQPTGGGSATAGTDLLDAQVTAFISDDAAPAAPVDALVASHAPLDAAVAVHPAAVDAAVAEQAPRDAETVATVARDAAAATSPAVDAGVDKKKAAADLYAKAHAALEDGDPDKALAYADESLKLRRTEKTLIERARALQRLDRIDEAIKSVDEATEIDPKSPAAWEARALILWGAHRYDDAKQAMQKYLELDPEGRSAESFHHLIDSK